LIYIRMSTPASLRILRDLNQLQHIITEGVSAAPVNNNIMIWDALILGPPETPFEDGTFKISIEFTENYPYEPPAFRFLSKMFHPNVYSDGTFLLDILHNHWNPSYTVSSVLISILSLLSEPNLNSSVNPSAAQLYQENQSEYVKTVKECVELSWMD
ncbi:unnamed protein product, partial [Allacma fusca]